jgi:hypothetical protein
LIDCILSCTVLIVVIELRDKKRQRLLKKLSKAMDNFIKEISDEQKLQKEELEYNKQVKDIIIREHDRLNSD